ncbi:hypothetical protein Pcinc_005197 [Petrolisthes cinctipes]|uniref:Regulatory protein zeste n=1 Tax=Petrolisthes cinctipes TaxID=88211 RepID=A0AAE1GK00_PETCI|nr:hypothetical protein Pcinc_005197 [Petrolisthes cinctipes]
MLYVTEYLTPPVGDRGAKRFDHAFLGHGSRRANFTDEEMMAMILGWQDRQDVLRERFSQNITAERKKQAWEDVTSEVNSVSRVLRGREEVKK